MRLSKDLINKYNHEAPRYTSYPPANKFLPSFTNKEYQEQIIASNHTGNNNLSFYVHIPFCPSRCYFCGCNTKEFPKDELINNYVECVIDEIKMVAPLIDKQRRVTQVHWGGGTPNSIPYHMIEQIMDTFRELFIFAPDAEIAIECSPAYLSLEQVSELRRIGFTRMSLGVQDFHEPVLQAINRKPSMVPVNELIEAVHAEGFKGVNIDLVYGLPLQTVDSFAENISAITETRPDRLATFSYAHVPWFNSNQQKLERFTFPNSEQKMNMMLNTCQSMMEAGYEMIGMDHFALPDDDLSIARGNHQLSRNFQGYNTKRTTGQVYAFGVSGISQLSGAYAQNVKDTDLYMTRIQSGKLGIERGYALTQSDQVIRNTINEVMCNGYLDYKAIADHHNISLDAFYHITQFEPHKLNSMINDGLVTIGEHSLSVSPEGMMVVRTIATCYDPNYAPTQNVYSRSF